MTAVLQIYLFSTRFFLHLCTTAVIYLLVSQWIAVPKIYFLLLILPLAVLIEYIQHAHRATDSISKIVLIRDTVFVLLIVALAFFLHFLGVGLSIQLKIILFIIVMVLLLTASLFIEQYKPAGRSFFYKHVLDILAYALGPFIIYPLIIKYLF